MRTLHALCVAFAFIGCAVASPPPLDITEYAHTSFGPSQGAPAVIWALAQTSDGFLWLGSSNGLYRFDGVRFEKIDGVGTVPLLGQYITALEAPGSGGLWIGYEFGGASFLDQHGLKNYPKGTGGFPDGTTDTFTRDRDGVVWAGTSRGLLRFDGQHWIDVTQTLGLPLPYAHDVMADKQGNLWIESGEYIALLRRGSARVHVYAISTEERFLQDSDGRVWNMGHDPDCLYLLDPTRDDTPPCRRLPRGYVAGLIDRSGGLWANRAALLSVLAIPSPEGDLAAPAEEPQSMPDPRSLVLADGAQPSSAFQDREGNVWFGTTRGLEQLRLSRLRKHRVSAGHVTVAAGRHNSLWVATTDNLTDSGDDFFQLKEGIMIPYRRGPTQITASSRDTTGVLWAGGYGRLWKLNDSVWEETRELTNGPGDTPRPTQAIARDGRGDLWLSITRVGLFRLRDRQSERVLVPGIPASAYPLVIYADGDASVWLGYGDGRLAALSHDAWRLYTEKDGLNVGGVEALGRINGQLWIGGERGLQRIQGSHFESLPGLSALGAVTGLLQGRNGDVWLNTSTGGIHIDGQELRYLGIASMKALAYEKFDLDDGMPGVPDGVRPLPTVLESDDGRVWFEAQDRFSWIDPSEHIRNTVTPAVIIGRVMDDGRGRDPEGSLTLFSNVHNVAIDYTATSLSIPSRVRFKYRLENFDKNWQAVGTRRTAYYNNLPPGRYVFHVIAANDDGVWNTQGAAVALVVPPLFYQTPWFRALCVALALAVIAALFFARLRQVTVRQRKRLEQRMEDRLNERTRIARELHDSLLQGFHGLMFRLEAVRQLLPGRPGEAANTLNAAMQLGDQAMNEGREAVQNLRSPWFDEHDLPASLGALGAELAVGIPTESRPEYRVVVEGRPRELSVDVRDDAYRIVREAVRNAYEHAKARHIETELSFGDSDLCIRVRDDGIGVDAQILAQGQRPGHWGLPGMRERSESFGGRLNVWSERSAGTEIELRIPAALAYARRADSAYSWIRELFYFARRSSTNAGQTEAELTWASQSSSHNRDDEGSPWRAD